MKGVWQPLCAVDVHMDVSLTLTGRSCRPSFWNFARNLGNSQPITHGEMRWLRLRPNPYSSHINVLYIKGVWQPLYAVDVHMDVSPQRYGCTCRPSFWNFARNLGQLTANNSCWNAVIEAVDPTRIHLTSMSYIWKVFNILYMLWMCIRMCPHLVTAAHANQAVGILVWATHSQ
jgi:hypothetical protein